MLYIYLLLFTINIFTKLINKKELIPKDNITINYSEPKLYSFTLQTGRYKVKCYGAQGGWSYCHSGFGAIGGKGAMVSGYFNVTNHNQIFYAYVGGKGSSEIHGLAAGGFNGGGLSGECKKYHHKFKSTRKGNGPGGGGGATDIRIGDNDISHRIIVAAGGSGASCYTQGAPGGDLNGYDAFGISQRVNQVNGNANGIGSNGGKVKHYPSSGAGGGYRGGLEGSRSNQDYTIAVSDSGSSYISGYPGCTSNHEMEFDSYEMKSGINEGNGLIEIESIFLCPDNCSICEGPNNCINCDAPFRLFDGLCYLECPTGSIDHVTYCEKCDPSCFSCSGIPTNCTSCRENDFIYNEKCYKECPKGTLEFGNECKDSCPTGTYFKKNKCEECDLPCLECIDKPSKCTECPEGKYLFNNECVSKCPERTVRDGNKCLTECESDQFLYNHVCYKHCPKGTFDKGIVCEDCKSPCLECRNDANMCLECIEKTYLYYSQCVNECPENFYYYHNTCVVNCPSETFLNGIICLDQCPNGKYGFNHMCKDCDSSCESCINSSKICTKCNINKYLYNNQCVNECPNISFIYENECVTKCPIGTYPVENICQDEDKYYESVEIHKRVPMVSKTVSAVIISILVVLLIFLIVILVCCLVPITHFKYHHYD